MEEVESIQMRIQMEMAEMGEMEELVEEVDVGEGAVEDHLY